MLVMFDWRIARALVILLLLSLIGLATLPWGLSLGLIESRQALETGDSLSAASSIARVAAFSPWRGDLWEQGGEQALVAGDAELAIDLFRRAEALDLLTPGGRLALGDALSQSGDLEGAIYYWESALSAGHSPSDAHARLVEAYRELGDLEKEIEHGIALVELRPGDAQLAYRLGLALAAVSPETSLAYLVQAQDLDPELVVVIAPLQRQINSARRIEDPGYTYLFSGRALAQLGEWVLAAEAFNRAVIARPDYAEAWAYLGEARQHLGEDGLPDLQEAYEIDPGSIAVNTFYAFYWQRKSDYDSALVYLNAALEANSNSPALLAELGRTYALSGDLAAALAQYERAVELAPRDPLFWRVLAEFTVVHEYQLRETGLPAARKAIDLDPEDPASLDVMAQILFLLGDVNNARQFLNLAVEADPSFADAHLHLALVHLEEGESFLAYQQLTEALSLSSPGSPTAEHARRLLEQLFP